MNEASDTGGTSGRPTLRDGTRRGRVASDGEPKGFLGNPPTGSMGYEVIDPYDHDPLPDRPSTAWEISDHYVLPPDAEGSGPTEQRPDPGRGPEQVGMRLYLAHPGEQLPNRYHYHEEQEEIFFVVEGELHVETPEGDFVVGPHQVFVVEPGSPHRGFNPADSGTDLRVLSIGAPSYRVLGRNDGRAYDPAA